ncbi:hypothetical protein HRR83_000854 [Exophiala dermatitidis]|uniref:Uncharacterized protein n=1 Tax=Exophiala dermatitidis TaxID=5970 RepID=A0AAN6F2N2_EXODE|nr:hypothetical protein HRR74_000858 [Exophiala dermatitidis]KAJ4528736.1 hypothetical protein HRR73_001359 [Exophiala dermatitidis]KAJ4530122.1 hypothetical protein HRR76_009355 [Exophiala dermatitidis]KAJ4558885.1 hypothetical protein HRR77_000857 [Exophiala dermatitidis]KAJ4581090.1 hypothetical protein HRR79_000141 [Exophiala dermatitidis]
MLDPSCYDQRLPAAAQSMATQTLAGHLCLLVGENDHTVQSSQASDSNSQQPNGGQLPYYHRYLVGCCGYHMQLDHGRPAFPSPQDPEVEAPAVDSMLVHRT